MEPNKKLSVDRNELGKAKSILDDIENQGDEVS